MNPPPEQAELYTRTYTALGKFVVSFSGLLHSLETSTVQLIAPFCEYGQMMRMNTAIADRTASPIVGAFFSVFYERWKSHIGTDEKKILKVLRRELDSVVKERNRLMHDVWMYKTGGEDPGPNSMSRFRIRAHGEGVEFEDIDYHPEQFDLLTNKVNRLSSVVNGLAWYMR